MLSPQPNPGLFDVVLPNEFFIPSVVDKYNLFLKQYNYPFETIQQMFSESLQSYDMPDFGFNMISQNMIDVNNAGYAWNQIPKTSEQSLIQDKLIQLTFRHVDGFMTYFMALELFFARYKLGFNTTKREPFGTTVLKTKSALNEPVCKIQLHKCQIVGLNGIGFSYSSPNRNDFTTFNLTIGYTEFVPSLNIPDFIFDKQKPKL